MSARKTRRGHAMTAGDVERAIELIVQHPLPRVREMTGLSYAHLARLAQVRLVERRAQ
jgi:hypothetical protein